MFYRSFMALAFISILGSAINSRADDKTAAKELSDQDKATAAKLDREIPEINFSGQELGDVIDFMRDVTGANLFVNWNALKSVDIDHVASVKLQLKNAKFKDALTRILNAVEKKKGSVQFTVEEGVIVISIIPDPQKPAQVIIAGFPEKMDRAMPEINFAGQGLADALDFMEDITGLKFNVDWKALKEAGIPKYSPVTARVREVKMSTCLKFILESVTDGKTPLQCRFKDGVGTITTVSEPEKKGK